MKPFIAAGFLITLTLLLTACKPGGCTQEADLPVPTETKINLNHCYEEAPLRQCVFRENFPGRKDNSGVCRPICQHTMSMCWYWQAGRCRLRRAKPAP